MEVVDEDSNAWEVPSVESCGAQGMKLLRAVIMRLEGEPSKSGASGFAPPLEQNGAVF